MPNLANLLYTSPYSLNFDTCQLKGEWNKQSGIRQLGLANNSESIDLITTPFTTCRNSFTPFDSQAPLQKSTQKCENNAKCQIGTKKLDRDNEIIRDEKSR